MKNSESSSVNLASLKIEFQTELKRILKFWGTEVLDKENGGFLGRIDHFGKKYVKENKGCILNSRILWTFSSAYRTTKEDIYKSLANKSYHYINTYFTDALNGGVFWELDYQGQPINTRKQAYAQSFALYGYSEYYRATQKVESREKAIALYELIESKFWDKDYSGYIEALSANWESIDDMRLSDKDLNAPKSMNTHLHILEAYSNLHRIWPEKRLKESIIRLLNIFQNFIIDKKTSHFILFFGMDWEVKSTAISYGHDIEGAWLLHEAAHLIADKTLIKNIQETAVALVDLTLKEGLDSDGSVFNEFSHDVLDKDKHWWPQAEAMVGLMDAYQINENPLYLSHIQQLWTFIKIHIVDHTNGEWFWRVDTNGTPKTTEDKVGFWKCPYHNSRALMELIERINTLKHVG